MTQQTAEVLKPHVASSKLIYKGQTHASNTLLVLGLVPCLLQRYENLVIYTHQSNAVPGIHKSNLMMQLQACLPLVCKTPESVRSVLLQSQPSMHAKVAASSSKRPQTVQSKQKVLLTYNIMVDLCCTAL